MHRETFDRPTLVEWTEEEVVSHELTIEITDDPMDYAPWARMFHRAEQLRQAHPDARMAVLYVDDNNLVIVIETDAIAK